jgi:anti-anti-sigma factor
MPLEVARHEHGDREILAVVGELDLETAPTLVSAAFALIDAGATDLIINASELRFCDSSGLTAFVRIANRLEPDGGRLAIVEPHPIVYRVLEVSGLVEAFVVAPSLGDALGELDKPRS